jgi:arabinose-5-phosphate isomerase
LGQRLVSRVIDMMVSGESIPCIAPGATMAEALETINAKGLGAVLVAGDDRVLRGIITDGDIRRCLTEKKNILSLAAEKVMTPDPKHIGPETPAYDALEIMEKNEITVLPITKSDGTICGILHLHDILGKGQFKFEPKKRAGLNGA